MDQIFNAFKYLNAAFKEARSPQLRPWVAIPVLFNVLLFGALYWLAGSWIAGWTSGLAEGWQFEGFWSFLNSLVSGAIWLLSLLVWVLLLALFASLFTVVVQLVSAPFMGLLAEKVDRQISADGPPEETLSAMAWRTARREIWKTLDWLWRSALMGLVVLVVWLIPGVNVLASAIWFLWSGYLMGIQYVDYGADTRQVPFRTLKAQVRRRPWLVVAFGSLVLTLTMIPLVNLFIMPVAVIAGTRLWHEQLREENA